MSTRAPRQRRASRARTFTIADARRGSIRRMADADLSLEELEPELRALASELRKPPRSRGPSLDELAEKLREPGSRDDASLEEVAAELREPNRRGGSALDDVAAELREPNRRRGSSLEEVAKKLRRPTRRRRGASLASVAAKILEPARAEPANDERVIEGGPLDFVLPARPVAMELVGGRGHYERVIAAVTNANTSVWIATANAKELMVEDARARPGRRRSMKRASYVSILSLLDELAARGVELRLLHAELPSGPFREELAQHPRLVAGGLALRRCPRVHMKAVIVDGELLYLGSANWTGAGLGAKGSGRRNFELGFVTSDAQLIDQVQAIYERVWTGGECEGCKLRDECPGPLDDL
jgi:phosphatidylserine/phosphatidylglycerophosphate/cardiolipin synthase-like enzyme